MYEQTEEQVSHQEFFFNQTKLIFYFNDQTNNPKNNHKNITKSHQTSSLNYQKEETIKTDKQNIHQHISHLSPRQNQTSQCNRCERHLRAYETNEVQMRLSRALSASTKEKNRTISNRKSHFSKQNKGKSSRLKQEIRDENKVEIQEKKGQVFQMKRSQIFSLFGSIHLLYQKDFDFVMSQPLSNNERSVQKQQITKFAQSEPQKQQNNSLRNSSIFPQNEIPTRTSFIFTKQTAIISQFIKNKNLRKKYDNIVKYKNSNGPYVDKEFSHQNYLTDQKIKTQWRYISPDPLLPMLPSIQNKSHKFIESETDFPFVNFLKFLYRMDPNYLIRLLEPPVNNVFSVWFCVDEIFQPVVVDGYFPQQLGSNKLFGQDDHYLWLPIFIKAICKLCKTFNPEIISQITFKQLYYLLNGQPLKSTPIKQFENSEAKLIGFYKKKKNNGKIIIFENQNRISRLTFDPSSQSFYLQSNEQKTKFVLKNENKGCFYAINGATNWFNYSFQILSQTLIKFELTCPKNCQISVNFGNKSGVNAKMYIYEPSNYGKNISGKHCLHSQFDSNSFKSVKLKAGNYKLFYEDGQKMNEVFNQTDRVVEDTPQEQCYQIVIRTSIQVEIGRAEMLKCKQGKLEDEQNFYQLS